MANTRYGTQLLILGILLLGVGGCMQSAQEWEPPLEETSTRFLQTEVDEALRLVRSAEGDLRRNPERAEVRLDEAARDLERMSKYYLPLLEARERAYDAHRFLYHGKRHRAIEEIEAVEEILDRVAETGGTTLQPVMKEALDLVSEAKAGVMAQSANAPEVIKSLAIKLNYMAQKSRLELPDAWPPSESGAI